MMPVVIFSLLQKRLQKTWFLLLVMVMYCGNVQSAELKGSVTIIEPRCEYRTAPLGIDTQAPRLGWRISTDRRSWQQRAYRILVASSAALLQAETGDLWDSGEISSSASQQITYRGKPLSSIQQCWWQVRVWGTDGSVSTWSVPSTWTMSLLKDSDWTALWISARDSNPVHKEQKKLFLPPARQYRRTFALNKPVVRALWSVSALGIADGWLNGQAVSDAYFEPGWSDYRKRAYVRTHDVTALLKVGDNCLGAVVADGWYSGYVGYGKLVGYGPYKTGRMFYGKTPALLAQLDITYEDGSHERISTDTSWQVTDAGPWREADLLMGEHYDARLAQPNWSTASFDASSWASVIRAEETGSIIAPYSDNTGTRDEEYGFQRPVRLQAYSGPPVRITREIAAKALREHSPGVYIFDLGENIAGNIRLHVTGPAGTMVRMRFGEMVHPDGRLMTENLRKARATDTYILRGDANGETWTPRFTYHGFQYVELSGLAQPPTLSTITGLVINSDTPVVASFTSSDAIFNQLFANITRTQLANFIDIPTDCPQRDERLGWAGDAQIYVRSSAYVADVASFFTKWLDDVEEAQRPEGPYPDYAPYPMGHGKPGKTFGTAWMDYGIICPWTIWQVYGDTRVVERHWSSMTKFMDWRKASSPSLTGVSIGNPWGDWLNLKEDTPVEFIDAVYYAKDALMMAEMAQAIGKDSEAATYRQLRTDVVARWCLDWLNADGTLKVQTQTAHVLALENHLVPEAYVAAISARLVQRITDNSYRMATGFLGTKPLLPVLSANGQHDLAVRMFQSRSFPSWGYEVENGATSIWERWDSYTKEDGFGRHNAAMNSFSHYAFGSVCEWMFRDLAGIDQLGAGMQHLIIRPRPPTPTSNPERAPMTWVRAEHTSHYGLISVAWERTVEQFSVKITIPPNCDARVFVLTSDVASIRIDGKTATEAGLNVEFSLTNPTLRIGSGSWNITAKP